MKVGDVLMVNTAAVKSSSVRGSELRMKEGVWRRVWGTPWLLN